MRIDGYFKERRGVFLIFALWLFILLSLFCLGLGFRTYVETRKTKLILNRTRAYYLAVSGVKLAKQVLVKDENKDVDYLGEDWAKEISETVKFSSPQKEGKITVNIKDESSRININLADEDLLTKLFGRDSGKNSDEKAKCVMEYRNPSSDAGFGECYSKDEGKAEGLAVPEELRLIKNISGEDYKKLKDLITVFGDDSMVNINTAGEELLPILLDILVFNTKITDKEKEEVFTSITDMRKEGKYYGQSRCEVLSDKCAVLQGNLTDIFKVNSHYFRVISEGEVDNVKRKIICVFDRVEDKVLYWYEE